LICLVKDIPSIDDLLLLIKKHNFDSILIPRIEQIPKYPAITKSQFYEWRQLWPIDYHENVKNRNNFTDKDIKILKGYMQRAIELAELGKSNQEIPIGCVIVDPKGSRILAECYDSRTTTRHPLKHAIIKCLDVVTSVENCNTFTTQHDYVSKPEKLSNDVAAYLCKGYDLFVTHEPCIMCSMALLHSRIGRVFYGKSSIVAGGLGSCFKLHTHNSLNHHFKVFKGLLEDQVETLTIDC
ncbi:11495_t:CDS:2, partial [Entrophospora sp. SA101]